MTFHGPYISRADQISLSVPAEVECNADRPTACLKGILESCSIIIHVGYLVISTCIVFTLLQFNKQSSICYLTGQIKGGHGGTCVHIP